MCQMCEEYEAELIRMGLIAEAKKAREERHPRGPRTTQPEGTQPPRDGDARG